MLKCLDFRIRVIDSLFKAKTKVGVFVGQGLVEVLLVEDILGHLICPEAECSTSTFHDDVRAKATQDTRFVFFTWVEVCDRGVVGAIELAVASRAGRAWSILLASEAESLSALEAEDVTTPNHQKTNDSVEN